MISIKQGKAQTQEEKLAEQQQAAKESKGGNRINTKKQREKDGFLSTKITTNKKGEIIARLGSQTDVAFRTVYLPHLREFLYSLGIDGSKDFSITFDADGDRGYRTVFHCFRATATASGETYEIGDMMAFGYGETS